MLLWRFKNHWLDLACLVTLNRSLSSWLRTPGPLIQWLLEALLLLYCGGNACFLEWLLYSLMSLSILTNKLLPNERIDHDIVFGRWKSIQIIYRNLFHSFCQLAFCASMLLNGALRQHCGVWIVLLGRVDLQHWANCSEGHRSWFPEIDKWIFFIFYLFLHVNMLLSSVLTSILIRSEWLLSSFKSHIVVWKLRNVIDIIFRLPKWWVLIINGVIQRPAFLQLRVVLIRRILWLFLPVKHLASIRVVEIVKRSLRSLAGKFLLNKSLVCFWLVILGARLSTRDNAGEWTCHWAFPRILWLLWISLLI